MADHVMPIEGQLDLHRDPQTEQLLDRRRVKAELQWIRLDDIDWPATLAQQVRSDGIDQERVDRYAEALDAGAKFPAVLAWDRASRGGWVLLGGIHRAKAHQGAAEWIAAYTVVDPHEPYVLALEHNAHHGDGLTVYDKARHAEILIERHGLSRAEAARTVGIAVFALDKARAIEGGRARANRFGVSKPWGKLPGGGQARLQWCCKDDGVFIEAVRTAANCQLKTPQIEELARLVTAAGGAGPNALQAVEDFEAEHHPGHGGRRGGTGGTGKGPAPARLRNGAIQLLSIDLDEVVERCLPVDRKATADQAFRLAKHLAAIAAALQAADKETAR